LDFSDDKDPAPVTRLSLESIDNTIQLDNGGETFVDDANLVSSSTFPQYPHEVTAVDQKRQSESAVANLQVLSQRWEKALFTTGGAINFSISFWFVFNWK
jgi:hypothetical protein